MKPISILNDVIGPVMRGPSSSHTAGSFHIASLARSLLGDEPASVHFRFDPNGSYGKVFEQQGADRAFAAGLMGWSILDDRFMSALEEAIKSGLSLEFILEELPDADHPNFVKIRLDSRAGRRLDHKQVLVPSAKCSVPRARENSLRDPSARRPRRSSP